MDRLTAAELLAWSALPEGVGELPEGPVVAVDCREPASPGERAASPGERAASRVAERLALAPVVVVATGAADGDPLAAALDVAADGEALDALAAAVAATPQAAVSLAVLLRHQPDRSLADGLLAESSTYALLQAGPEHRGWLASRPARPPRPGDDRPAVAVERRGERLHITLDRPHVRNAFDRRMRDDLYEALAVAASDPAVELVLDGAGPAFCSGGDLDEFGTVTDPPSAHLIRLRRNVGWALAGLAGRTTVRVHGACVGAGVELPAFAGRVEADPGTTFRLPEVAMGLVPGAGGTVSLPRRIGRQRTALLALTGATIDARTALGWGLVDELAGMPGR